jgi:hypothetical protein
MKPLISGALAGLVATMAMTAAMRRLHRHLPAGERYPLPPREIVDRIAGLDNEVTARTATMLSHFGFGATAGALFALPPMQRLGGVIYGLGIWTVSYLGWIPVLGILAPATRHPARRNLLMLGAHVVWGLVLAKSFQELEATDEALGRAPGEGRLSAERVEMESKS